MTAHITNSPPATRTPAGLQSSRELFIRRLGLGTACAVIYLALVGGVASILGRGGWTLIDALMLLCFAVAAPWSVLGFVNAMIGAWLCWRPSRELLFYPARSAPDAAHIPAVAIIMTIRNEDPRRAFLRLRTVKESLDASGGAESLSYFILSDTSDEGTAADEEAAFSEWMSCETSDPPRLFYRRRPVNTGYKAGNLAEFCKTHGGRFDYFVPLDADSLMTARTVLGMIGVMEAFPRIGILQSLVVGLPSSSAFARVFQFGMRHGMRPYTLGCTWWSGDCSQFWGHNAVVRLKPFLLHCRLNDLPGGPPWGGPVLSHDQIEAALMRRAGYEVRVIASESGSYEENPPTILEFMRRDRRWCQGNLQYLPLLSTLGLKPTSRFQLLWAVMMFIGVPAWTFFILLAALKTIAPKDQSVFPAGLAAAVYVIFLIMFLAPKLIGFLDVTMRPGEIARYGGRWRFAAGCTFEIVFSFLLSAVTTFRTSVFVFELILGRSVLWSGQARDTGALAFKDACREFWPQSIFGAAVIALLAHSQAALAWWSLPLTAGYVFAIPFALITSHPAVGAMLARAKLCSIPEEIVMVPEIEALRRGAGAEK